MATPPNQSFLEAIKVFGSQTAMARAINKPVQLVNQIKLGNRPMPDAWAPLIEEATAALGQPVMCEALAPSVNWAYLRHGTQVLTCRASHLPLPASTTDPTASEVGHE